MTGKLLCIDTRVESFPFWDYKHASIIKHHPIVMYWCPIDSITSTYTIKGYWKDTTWNEGCILIMNDKDLPHQGACIGFYNVSDGQLVNKDKMTQKQKQILNNVSLPSSIQCN